VSATEYEVIVEEGERSFGAYVPDLPGCVAVGESRDEAMQLLHEAIEMHIESLRENGEFVPPPGTLHNTAALE
jgi:predicted RNase H-like HicB family nuclease